MQSPQEAQLHMQIDNELQIHTSIQSPQEDTECKPSTQLIVHCPLKATKCNPNQPINQADIDQIYKNYFIPNINHPEALQHKVYFDLMSIYGMKKKTQDEAANVRKDVFYVGVMEDGTEFIKMIPDSKAKEQPDETKYAYQREHCIIAQGGLHCPVASFKKYVAKLNPHCDMFFQKPNLGKNVPMHIMWYLGDPVGPRRIFNFMPEISMRAGLETIYNHACIKRKDHLLFKDKDPNV